MVDALGVGDGVVEPRLGGADVGLAQMPAEAVQIGGAPLRVVLEGQERVVRSTWTK